MSKLTTVLHLLVRLGLVQDLLRAGNERCEQRRSAPHSRRCGLERLVVTAGLMDDTAALLRAGFVPAPETLQDIRLRAIRSDSWKAISATFGADDARRDVPSL